MSPAEYDMVAKAIASARRRFDGAAPPPAYLLAYLTGYMAEEFTVADPEFDATQFTVAALGRPPGPPIPT